MNNQSVQPLLPVKDWMPGCAREVLAKLGDAEFTSDDLHGHVPEPFHANSWGAFLNYMARKGMIVVAGHRKSDRPSANGREIKVWRRK